MLVCNANIIIEMDWPQESGRNRAKNDRISVCSSSLGWADVEAIADPTVFFCLEDFFPARHIADKYYVNYSYTLNCFP